MVSAVIDKINSEKVQKGVTPFQVGDTIRVHVKIREGDKERVQLFTGTVIGRRGSGAMEMFTVRRVSHGVGVERVFPVHSPFIAKIEVESSGRVRRAKLSFLRQRAGKQARLRSRAGEAPAEPEGKK